MKPILILIAFWFLATVHGLVKKHDLLRQLGTKNYTESNSEWVAWIMSKECRFCRNSSDFASGYLCYQDYSEPPCDENYECSKDNGTIIRKLRYFLYLKRASSSMLEKLEIDICTI